MSCSNEKHNETKNEKSFIELVDEYKDDIPEDVKNALARIAVRFAFLNAYEMSEGDYLKTISQCQENIYDLYSMLLDLTYSIGQDFGNKK